MSTIVTALILKTKVPGILSALVFDAMDTALMQCATDVESMLVSHNQNDPDVLTIKSLINLGNFQAAIDTFNLISPEYKIVLRSMTINTQATIIPSKNYVKSQPAIIKAGNNVTGVCGTAGPTYSSNTINTSKNAYKASSSGASCRRCPTTSEYAYADRPDGTYLCYSCKGMLQVFGGIDS